MTTAPEPDGALILEPDVRVPVQGRLTLATEVLRPRADGKYPAVLARTQYGKSIFDVYASAFIDPIALAAAGIVVVAQDCRGTGRSEGVFRQFHDEAADGADTIAWIAEQPWSDGRVTMVGGSYLATTQSLAATASPPALKGIVPSWGGSDFYDSFAYRGGALELGFTLRWAMEAARADARRRTARGEDVSEEFATLTAAVEDIWTTYAQVPLNAMPRDVSLMRNYGEWLEHPDRDEYWQAISPRDRYENFRVPTMQIGGWFDVRLAGNLENHIGLTERAGTEYARENQRLVVGPWGHNPERSAVSEANGDLHFGYYGGSPGAGDVGGRALAFLKSVLAEESVAGPRVRIFVMGANVWRDENEWPLARAVNTPYYLHAGGELSTEAPAEALPSTFRYDPADPVPTVSGNTLLRDGGRYHGPRDRRPIHDRPDVLVFRTEPLEHDVEVTGPVTVTLHVSTSALDTDFTAALLDIHPDGKAVGMTDGILRLRYREGTDHQVLATPGEVYRIEIDLVATSNVFKAGHRIGVDVSSSNLPRFDRNPNNGGVIAEATEADFVVADQTVFHDETRPSFITLPIVPN
ncbi:CocE/NonD family hydrolase [Microbacterium gorillae]|uniref:CocE/NonD family hydrolase n=1 Tax=Microbacterium gorillae TaxID=1231063 RepID=UPI0006936709|nr:CocE/NonD family hydrolase [Microbacterium gorillae]